MCTKQILLFILHCWVLLVSFMAQSEQTATHTILLELEVNRKAYYSELTVWRKQFFLFICYPKILNLIFPGSNIKRKGESEAGADRGIFEMRNKSRLRVKRRWWFSNKLIHLSPSSHFKLETRPVERKQKNPFRLLNRFTIKSS